MAISKLSTSERAFRKREAARLRQQRCRERKRQANLKKKIEGQQKAAQLKKSPLTPNKKVKLPKTSEEPNFDGQLTMMPRLQEPIHRHYLQRYPSQSPSLNTCESFPSLGSEPSPSFETSTEEMVMVSRPLVIDASPRSIMTSPDSSSPYSREIYHRSVRMGPVPPLLSINELDDNQRPFHLPIQRRRPNVQSYGPNKTELDAVHAMLSLKADSPSCTAPREPSFCTSQTPNWRYGPTVPQQRYHHPGNTPSIRIEHSRPQYAKNMMPSDVVMQVNESLRPGLHVYYRTR